MSNTGFTPMVKVSTILAGSRRVEKTDDVVEKVSVVSDVYDAGIQSGFPMGAQRGFELRRSRLPTVVDRSGGNGDFFPSELPCSVCSGVEIDACT